MPSRFFLYKSKIYQGPKHACYRTPRKRGAKKICPICFWDDHVSREFDPDSMVDVNCVLLRETQYNFIKFGICHTRSRGPVQKMARSEACDPDWRPMQ
ncbi:MAG: CPCC family cysteine-rich protein [Candidatus Sigynarchaeota archaeon]